MKECKYCGSPMKMSKKGNLYCSNVCWTKEPYATQIIQDGLEYEIEQENWGCRE